MERRLARPARQIRLDREAGDPCQPVAGKHQRPRITILTWNFRVDEDVLQLTSPAPARRTESQAGLAMANPK